MKSDIDILISVMLWQKRNIEYNALYTAFLMGCITEEEFEEEAKKFTIIKTDINKEEVKYIIDRVYELTGISCDTSDYADLFKCGIEEIEDVLNEK